MGNRQGWSWIDFQFYHILPIRRFLHTLMDTTNIFIHKDKDFQRILNIDLEIRRMFYMKNHNQYIHSLPNMKILGIRQYKSTCTESSFQYKLYKSQQFLNKWRMKKNISYISYWCLCNH